jgi:Domain of unknown function (DUF4395)
MGNAPKADPWRDTDVIDRRAPRFNHAVVATAALLGAAFGWPLLWLLMASQLLTGLTLGRRYCLPCLAYFKLVQPRIGEGDLEDARPPRLANALGFSLLTVASLVWWAGSPTAGQLIALLVGILALVASATGFCAGCELYRLSARLRGISPRRHSRLDLADLNGVGGAGLALVEFTHPLCADCHRWEKRLRDRSAPLVLVDVRERPDLARKYGIAVVPTVFEVAGNGAVLQRLAP